MSFEYPRDFLHVVQTRFNLATSGREEAFRNKPKWLDTRFDLFERYCLPAMAAQTCQDFEWIIYFDDQTPLQYRERIGLAQKRRPFQAFFTPLFDESGWRRALIATYGLPSSPFILTTTLDNDDAVSSDYIEQLHRNVESYQGSTPATFNFCDGFIVHGTRLYRLTHRGAAFVNYLERYDGEFITSLNVHHMTLERFGQVVQCRSLGAWAQIVHGFNVSNRPRGHLVSKNALADRFPEAICDQVIEPSLIDCLIDNVTARPIRAIRDASSRLIQRRLNSPFTG